MAQEALSAVTALGAPQSHVQPLIAYRTVGLATTRAHLKGLEGDPRTELFIGMAGLSQSEQEALAHGGSQTMLAGLLELDDASLFNVLERRKQALEPHLTEQEFAIERHVFDFKDRVDQAVARQQLPIGRAMAQRKIDTVMAVAADPLTLMAQHDATFSPTDRLIRVGLHMGIQGEKAHRLVIDHELTHSLGGIACSMRGVNGKTLHVRRSGLRHIEGSEVRMAWIDEAVVERTSQLLRLPDVNYEQMDARTFATAVDVGRYIPQDKLTQCVLAGARCGVRPHTLLAASFADDDPTQPHGSRSVAQARLYSELDQAWGGFDTIRRTMFDVDATAYADDGRPTPATNPYYRAIAGLHMLRDRLSKG
jgi:hypothetical protein